MTTRYRIRRQAAAVRVAGAVLVGAAVWLTLTAAAVLSYVYAGLDCRGLACLWGG